MKSLGICALLELLRLVILSFLPQIFSRDNFIFDHLKMLEKLSFISPSFLAAS